MPHLRYCNRYWYVSGDELSCPALFSLISRILWTGLIAAVYGTSYSLLSDCDRGWLLEAYLLISIIVFVADIVCDMLIIYVSLQGSITAMSERKQLGSLLTTRIALICMQTACSIFGIVAIAAHSGMPCNDNFDSQGLRQIFIAIVAASQLFDSILYFCCGSCLLRSSSSLDSSPEEVMQDEMEAWVTWANRCQQLTRSVQILSCNLFGGSQINDGFDEVAKALMQFFHHQGFLDVVASDVVAGFVLVRLEQRQHRKHHPIQASPLISKSSSSQDSITDSTKGLQPSQPKYYHQRMTSDLEMGSKQMEEAITNRNVDDESAWFRGSIYALAMYTHLMALYVHPCTGLCRLCCSFRGRCCRGGHTCLTSFLPSKGRGGEVAYKPEVVGDNCCGLHYVGMHVFTNLIDAGESSLLHASFVNDTYMKPFGIFLDHARQWVVVSIRGTLSLEDCITDVTFEPCELSAMGEKWGFDGKNRWAHSGMVRAADRIRTELDRLDILRKIYSTNSHHDSNGHHSPPNMSTPLTEDLSKFGHYRLTVVGHSLGAGAAILLAMMLRHEHPSLQCMAYGTPASVLDRQSCMDVKSFVTSLVLDNDVVSRLSFRSLCNLRNQVLDAISRARINKIYIMKALFHDVSSEELMYPVGQEPESEFKKQVQQFKDTLQARLDKLEHELFLPGRIVHIARTAKVRERFRTRFVYNLFERDLDFFTQITVSSTMVPDHLPDRYYAELMRVGR